MQHMGQNIIVALDCSASMSEPFGGATKIGVVADAVELMLPRLARQQGAMIGLVGFNERAFVISPLLWPSSRDLLGRVKNVRLGGSTNLLGGINLACDLLLKRLPQYPRRIILLTDGGHNAGSHTPEQVIIKATANKITIDTIGIGNEGSYNKQSLIQLATITGGEFIAARDLPKLLATFQRLSSPKPFRSPYPVSTKGRVFHLNPFRR